MEEETRRLAAIMLTDVVGYTALTQVDEALTLALLEEHTTLLRPLFQEHGGREVKSTGDGFLVEFASALQAVLCAAHIQRALHERNAIVPLDRVIHVRIGIHLGDVVHRGGDIFGDGVNITARIQPLAEPGGICLSRQVYDQVWNKTDLQMTSLGKKDLKNVRVPIEVFEMLLPWAPPQDSAPDEASRSRIAVLPLVSISPEAGDEYFADGLTEELIFTLSKSVGLEVIALTSVMKFRGAKKRVSEIAKELGVGSVLEGSVRKAGSRLRITLQLIDATSEAHLWSEVHDRTLDDIFAVQSDVARSVVSALEVRLAPKPARALEERKKANPEAFTSYLKGRVLLGKRTGTSIGSAIVCLERAIQLDPARAETHAALATAYAVLPDYSPSAPADSLAKAKTSARTALALDESLPEAHTALGLVLQSEWDWTGAEKEFRRAIELVPSYTQAHHWLGLFLLGFGRFGEAISALKTAQGLDPLSPVLHTALGQVYLYAGQDDLALGEFSLSTALGEDNRVLRMFRGEAHLRRGNHDLARIDFERAQEMSDSLDPFVELGCARLREVSGEKGALEASFARVLEHAERERVSPYWLATFAFALGRKDEGFSFLERAFAERDFELNTLAVDPRTSSVHSDDRYAGLLRRMSLPSD